LPGVDLAELGDRRCKPLTVVIAAGSRSAVSPAIRSAFAAGDLVQHLFHLAGEGVVNQLREVLLQQPGDREGQPGRHQRGALLEDIVAGGDGAQDRGVRRGPADLHSSSLATSDGSV
jgi:hypothetical protein